jgi:sterol desaturase/sphingolipid hydroxylase (fatty acid hydroxylase superfamily)
MDRADWIIVSIAFTLFAVAIRLEISWWRRRGVEKYEYRDSLASYSLVVMQFLCGVVGKSLFIIAGLEWFRVRGPGLPVGNWWSGVILFLGVDLGYYLFHRASHRVRLLWAIHESHHSSERMNFSVALRQPPLEPLIDWVFFIGLAWLGFPAKSILTVYAFNLFYQFFIHTEMVDRLPWWVEMIFNTPSHHRAHHGTNARYIDRNYGGTLIIWDRLFGTYTAEVEPVRYGVLHPVRSHNPLLIGFHLWLDILRDVAASRSWRERLGLVLAPPEWAQRRRR